MNKIIKYIRAAKTVPQLAGYDNNSAYRVYVIGLFKVQTRLFHCMSSHHDTNGTAYTNVEIYYDDKLVAYGRTKNFHVKRFNRWLTLDYMEVIDNQLYMQLWLSI